MDRKSTLLVLVGVLSVVISVAFAYDRFYIERDYLVEYEIACDPSVESCYVFECDLEADPECETWYYSLGYKYANDLYAACGPDITECEAASVCQPTDRDCEIQFCGPEEECVGPLGPEEEEDVPANDEEWTEPTYE